MTTRRSITGRKTTRAGATSLQEAPAVLWNPRFTNSSASFGGPGRHFGFNITGATNIPCVLEACTNLGNPAWATLQSFTLTNGLVAFTDAQATNYPRRFYRITSP